MWTRRPGSRDLVFAELMLWGWARRCWTERRLAQARALYDSVTKAGSTVSIELLEELSERLHARDAYTHGHNQRVARHAESIARAMHLSPTEVAKIRTAGAVHDVGKIYTPREILNNPGTLNDREYAIVKLHSGDGADMLEAAGDPEITAIVRHHHERVDGRGYPDGLLGSNIPLGARIIAVADTFDAITSNRPYRPGKLSQESTGDPLPAGGLPTRQRRGRRLSHSLLLPALDRVVRVRRGSPPTNIRGATNSLPQHWRRQRGGHFDTSRSGRSEPAHAVPRFGA